MNFWQALPKPFLVLAPMDDVTDVVFREVVARFLPRPDVFFTEFTSADDLCSKGKNKTLEKLKLTENHHPIVAQIWGTNPENIYTAAGIVQDLGFDGVDINMGCPVPAVIKKGAGAGMIQNQALAKEIIDAAKRGAPKIPFSVKTRIGFKQIETEDWIGFLLNQKLDALTVHGRTAKQMSTGSANWDEIKKVVAMRDEISPNTIVSGNGDIKSYKEALNAHENFNVDGVMVGRGIFSNPWVFEKKEVEHTKEESMSLLVKHINYYHEVWGEGKHFEIMKKFLKMYVNNFPHAQELRIELMNCKTAGEMLSIIQSQ